MSKCLINNSVTILKESYNNPIIRDLDITKVKVFVIDAILKDIALKGIKEDNLPNQIITDDIQKMIITKYSVLTPLEIELAFQMERYGEFEEKENHFQFYGTEYVGSILKKYVNWKQKKAVELNLSRYNESLKPTEVSIDEINKEYLEKILSEIKKGIDYRNIEAYLLYDEIPKESRPTKEYAEKIFNDEKSKLIKEYELKKTIQKSNLAVRNLTELFNKNFKQMLITRCRNIVTCEYLAKKYNLK